MTILQMLGQSGLLTLLGLCVVFSFLIVLILAMNLLRIFVHACHLDEDSKSTSASSSASPVASAPAADNGALIAAIAAFVHEKESK